MTKDYLASAKQRIKRIPEKGVECMTSPNYATIEALIAIAEELRYIRENGLTIIEDK